MTMWTYGEFHKIVAERIDKLTSLMNYMKTLNSDLTKLILEKDGVEKVINPQEKIKKKHVHCLKDVEATNDKIQKVEDEMKLICSNTQGLIQIIDKITWATKERPNEGRLQEQLIIPNNLIMGVGNIGNSGAVLSQDSAINVKYENFQINCYNANTEHCKSSRFSHGPKHARFDSVGMDSTADSSWAYVPPSKEEVGTISIFGVSEEASSAFSFYDEKPVTASFHKNAGVNITWPALPGNDEPGTISTLGNWAQQSSGFVIEYANISINNIDISGDEYFYGIGAIRFAYSGRIPVKGGMDTTPVPFVESTSIAIGEGIGTSIGMCRFASEDIIGISSGAIFMCSDGIDYLDVLIQNSIIGVGELLIDAGGNNDKIIFNNNRIYNAQISSRIDGNGYTNVDFQYNSMCGRKLHFWMGGSGQNEILFKGNDIRGGELNINIDGSGQNEILFKGNDIRGGELNINIDGSGSTNVIIRRLNDFRQGKLCVSINGHGNTYINIIGNDICGGGLNIRIGGTGKTEIFLCNNDIRGGKLRVKIEGAGDTYVLLENNNICGSSSCIKIDGTSNGHVIVENI